MSISRVIDTGVNSNYEDAISDIFEKIFLILSREWYSRSKYNYRAGEAK